jgi:TetR/AcrR family transcriptional repressor of nem operon
MGRSRAEKAKTHKRIVSIASKRLREEGFAGPGIAELMKETGLTFETAAAPDRRLLSFMSG